MPIVAGFVLFFATLAITLTSPPVSAYGADGIVKITVTIAPADSTPSIIVKVKRASNSAVADNEITLTRTSASTFTGDLNNGHLSCSPANSREILLGATVYNNSGGGVTSQILTTLGTSPLVSVCGDPTEKSFSVDIQPVTTNPGATTGTVCGTLSYYNPDTSQVVPYVTDNSNIAAVPSGATNGKTAKTDNNGKYCIGNLTPGTFKLVATYTSPQGKSLDSWTSGDFQITAGQTTTIDHAATPPGGGTSTTGATADTETCNLTGIGWIVCPVSIFIAKVTDSVYNLVEQLLYFQPAVDMFDTKNPIYAIWNNMRNLANIMFVVALFAVVFSQATSFGITNYGIKKMLPRIIAAAILVNISYYICVFGIDVSNIVGAGIDGVIKSVPLANGAGVSYDSTSGTGAVATLGIAALTTTLLGVSIAGSGGIVAALSGLLVFLPIMLMAVLTALVVLVGRQALLILLIIIAPLAFVAMILPNTEKLFASWRKALTTMLVFYPLVAVLFAGSQVAASVLRLAASSGNASDQLIKVMSLGIQVFPLFALPFLLKFSGGVLGKVAGMVNNPNKGPFDRMRKGLGSKAERYQANAQALKLDSFNKSGKNPNIWRRGAGATAARRAQAAHLDTTSKQNLQLAQQQQVGHALVHDERFAKAAAGGNTDPDAIARAVAQGISALDEIESKNLKAGQTVLSNAKLDGSGLMKLISGADQIGANGQKIAASQSMRMAAVATMASQGRQIDEVAGHVAASGDADLQKFFVGQVQSNYNAIKPRNGGMVDEEFLREMAAGNVTSANIKDYRVAAAGQGATKLNVDTMASQDASYLKDLKTYLDTKIAAGAVTIEDRRVIEVAKQVQRSTARTKTNGETSILLENIGKL